jgi:hypothetical protein
MFPISGVLSLVLAIAFGFAFGWLLHRGRVTSYDVIVGQLRLKDFTVLKVMLTAIVVGGLGVLALVDLGLAKAAVRDANLGGVVLGAAVFGVGMALYGYCPGTGLAAIATGSVHALVGAVGMLAGGMLYAFSYPWLKGTVLAWWNLGQVTLPGLTGTSPLIWFAALAAIALGLFATLEARRL